MDAEMAVRLRYVKLAEVKVRRWTRRVRKRRCIFSGIDWSGGSGFLWKRLDEKEEVLEGRKCR